MYQCILIFAFAGCCLLCVSFCLFFFFKQKTAYEMRISDWSSDVCSSDLMALLTGNPVITDIARVFPATLELATLAILFGVLAGLPLGVYAATHQIGRASCRERVCPYV